MKKLVVSMLVFITVFSMLNEDLQAGAISNVVPDEYCDHVKISWYVSEYTTHTNVHWELGKSGYSLPAQSGQGWFSEEFYLPRGYYSFKIHAVVSGKDDYSRIKSFSISGCSSTPLNQTDPQPPSPIIHPISNVRVDEYCDHVEISWYVSVYTTHTNVHWELGKSGYSLPAQSGQGWFSEEFDLPWGYYSFKIHAVVAGLGYLSHMSFYLSPC